MEDLKEHITEIKSYKVVESWLENTSTNTRISYLAGLAEFCKINEINPQQMLDIIFKEEEARLPQWERSINTWFQTYDKHCKDKKRSIKTRNLRITIVNGFISFHGLSTYSEKGKRRNKKDFKTPNKREALTKKDIKKLVSACKNLKMKAIILTQISSGLSASDTLNLKIKDFQDGLTDAYDKKSRKTRRICKLHLKREKTKKEFITFLSEESVTYIEKYLKLERKKEPQPEEALFPGWDPSKSMTNVNLHKGYENLNKYLGWSKGEKGEFQKATSHMMRKFFNTQLIYAGMPEEIREHFMGHVINDKVRDAYFLRNEEELQKVYLEYMDKITIGDQKAPVNLSEYTEIKMGYEDLMTENKNLKKEIIEIQEMIKLEPENPDKELVKENQQLSEALSGIMYNYEAQKAQMSELKDELKEMQQKIREIENTAST